MRHTIYTITIERASIYFETDDNRYLMRLAVPIKKIRERAEDRFVEEFNKIFGNDEFNRRISNLKLQYIMDVRANITLPALHGCLLTWLASKKKTKKVKRNTKAAFEFFKEEFGKEFESQDDLSRIVREIKRLRSKLRGNAFFRRKSSENVEKFKLEPLVVGIENVIGRAIDRNMKLFQLKPYYDEAAKITQKKKHG